jgi:hypothetical protein
MFARISDHKNMVIAPRGCKGGDASYLTSFSANDEYISITFISNDLRRSSTCTTSFVYEDGELKDAFGEEEIEIFMPDASYQGFVEAQ